MNDTTTTSADFALLGDEFENFDLDDLAVLDVTSASALPEMGASDAGGWFCCSSSSSSSCCS